MSESYLICYFEPSSFTKLKPLDHSARYLGTRFWISGQ